VHECYTVTFARKTYEVGIPALGGPEAWPTAEGLQVHPPVSRTLPGRPKKLRAREPIELGTVPSKDGVGTMVRKKGILMHCTKCQQPGHNKRKCTQPATRA
ncbi:hypothetical protein LINGRAHAP2_LOCUS6741, partial [Linum grandiflorum]